MEQYERNVCIETIVEDWSPDEYARSKERTRLESRHYPIQYLRDKANEIRARRAFRSMSVEQIREYTRKAREQATAPAPAAPELPAEYTSEKIRRSSVEEIKTLNRIYGHDQVNTRLGYAKPQIGGMVREVNLEI